MRATLRSIALVYGGALAIVGGCAGVVASIGAAWARRLLHFTFSGVPATPGEALTIFAHNLAVTLVAFTGALVLAAPIDRDGRWWRIIRLSWDMLLATIAAVNLLLVGAAVAGYGTRVVRSLLPHGPVELLAYSCAIALYLQSRRQPQSLRAAAALVGTSGMLLAIAAVLEVLR
jgi:hypothetical protein